MLDADEQYLTEDELGRDQVAAGKARLAKQHINIRDTITCRTILQGKTQLIYFSKIACEQPSAAGISARERQCP